MIVVAFLRCSAPEYLAKPQPGELLIELAGNFGLGGEAHGNKKWNYRKSDFTGDNYISLRSRF
jgi:hypothetical protein